MSGKRPSAYSCGEQALVPQRPPGGTPILNLANGTEATINTGHLSERFPWEMPRARIEFSERTFSARGTQVLERRTARPQKADAFNQEIKP